MSPPLAPGTLYIVSTPIGNLEDITLRALAVLGGVDLVAAEDTRKTRFLLEHFKITKPLLSYFSYNEVHRTPELVAKLKAGRSVALVSDAGTPGISDPAFRIVRAALDNGIDVVSVPGPSAFLASLIASGLSSERFAFEGFLPVKKGRKTKLEYLKSLTQTIILYESPHRLARTLNDLLGSLGDRPVCVSRELTKKFEEHVRGTLASAAAHFSRQTIRGEFVIIIGAQPKN